MVRAARATAAILVFVIGVVAIAAVVYFIAFAPQDAKPIVGTTQPTTNANPATQPAPIDKPPRTYGELLKTVYPKLPSTQPLGVPLDLSDAVHVTLTDPLYVCSRLDLWISRPDAEPAEEVLRNAANEQTHLVRERVLFAHWSVDEKGKWFPRLVVPRETAKGIAGADLVAAGSRRPIGGTHAYLWHRALSWGERIIVPTETGLSILSPAEDMAELHHEFAAPESARGNSATTTASPAEPQVTFDTRGLIAWMPWDAGKRGSDGAVRFVDGKFTPLGPAEAWPQRLVHVVPLLDGSVLQVVRTDDGRIAPQLTVLDAAPVDEPKITALVDQLSDPDPDNRKKAFAELTRYGSGIWPLLEKLAEDQPPEAQIRLQQLLSNKTRPTLGGIALGDGQLETAARLPDGGVVFYSETGVTFPRERGNPEVVKPAWISVRPGRAIEILPPALMAEAMPATHDIYALLDEWVLSDEESGPQRLMFNHKTRLLRPDETAFGRLFAIDRRGRWMFRKTSAPTRADGRDETLVLDPTFADPTPRLPIWLIEVRNGTTGWDEKDWPVTKSGGAWALRERGWQAMDETKEKMLTVLPPRDDTPDPKRPLLVDADGNRYFDGGAILHVISKSGKHAVWPLPFLAHGEPGGTLLRAHDGRLFLFNQPGRIVRIKPTPGEAQPFKFEGTFTHRVPNSERTARIWLDGANRICVAYDSNRLAIMFPEGVIPPHIATMIPMSELH